MIYHLNELEELRTGSEAGDICNRLEESLIYIRVGVDCKDVYF